MKTVGEQFPEFQLKAVISSEPTIEFPVISNNNIKGKWAVIFFWPKDFTFVCPTEIKAFGDLNAEFTDRDTQVYGVSTDSEFVHLAWRQHKKELTDSLSDKNIERAQQTITPIAYLDL